jgi:hypothetical protein
MQSGKLAAAVVELDVPVELPLRLDEPEPVEPVPVLLEPGELEPMPAEPAALPGPVEDPPDMLEVLLPVPEDEPVMFEPEVDPVFEAVFKRAWPVALSLQCVAADTLELLVADGDVDDWAAAPTMPAPTTAADSRRIFNIWNTP